jgi:hypothetical protein
MRSIFPICIEEKKKIKQANKSRRQKMNVNEINQSFSNFYQQQIKQKYNNDVNLQVSDSNSVYSTMQQEDFASTIWNMTDSMPRANQISFTAEVLANKMLNQGITDENIAFLKKVSNRFSTDEMDKLKNEIMKNPKIQSGNNSAVIQEFLGSLEEIMSDKANEALQSQLKEKNLHKFRSMDEIFFQTSLIFDATKKGLFTMDDQEVINYDRA